jgi:hypothetical protein
LSKAKRTSSSRFKALQRYAKLLAQPPAHLKLHALSGTTQRGAFLRLLLLFGRALRDASLQHAQQRARGTHLQSAHGATIVSAKSAQNAVASACTVCEPRCTHKFALLLFFDLCRQALAQPRALLQHTQYTRHSEMKSVRKRGEQALRVYAVQLS